MLKNLKKALPLGLLISGAIATSAIAGSYTLRVGSGHPSAPTAYVTGMEKVFVPNIKKRVAAETGHKIKIIEAYAGKIDKVHETLEAVEKGFAAGALRPMEFGGDMGTIAMTKAVIDYL